MNRRLIAGLPRSDFGVASLYFLAADRDGTFPLHLGRTQAMQHSLGMGKETTAKTIEVPVRHAARALSEAGLASGAISILKIDTEGSEIPVLSCLSAEGILDRAEQLHVDTNPNGTAGRLRRFLPPASSSAGRTASAPHRGTNLYLSNDLMERYPDLDTWALPRPEFTPD